VDNRSGGGGVIGWQAVVRAANDGTTLLPDRTIRWPPRRRCIPNLGFDIRHDFTPVSLLVDYPTVFVVPGNSPGRTLRDFVDAVARQPAEQTFYGSMGAGSPRISTRNTCRTLLGVRMTQVPYRGMGPAFTDLLAGASGC
jgi:tripartite-type tricarboxylate transporter receptor subunit TctC